MAETVHHALIAWESLLERILYQNAAYVAAWIEIALVRAIMIVMAGGVLRQIASLFCRPALFVSAPSSATILNASMAIVALNRIARHF